MPKYSFILPAYKRLYLSEAIESILSQSFTDFELVILDDDSPEDLSSIVYSYTDARISYCKNSHNIGGNNLVEQWNHAIKFASGEWIILASDDDWYEPDFLAEADILLSKYSNVDLFRARICSCDRNLNICNIECCLPELTSYEEFFYHMREGLLGGVPQYIFRRTKLESIGGFYQLPKAWGSDDITALLMAGNGVVTSGKILFRFRWSGLNISTVGKYQEEKIVASFLYHKFMYALLLSCNTSYADYKQFFIDSVKRDFVYKAKHLLLRSLYRLPWYKRYKFIPYIWNDTPYLNRRNKLSTILRVYVKKKTIR